jgi:hypothetical protein
VLAGSAAHAADAPAGNIQFKLTPRVCTLAEDEKQCETTVRAQWRSRRNESLCLVIVDRPEIKRCWEDHRSGVYSVELVFERDLTVELRDPGLQQVLVSRAIAVIREAIRLRPKRRQPWNIFY